ncbi:MAG: hypothetical protein MRERC_6c011 [Mycoplasmataceae bacterium RC_NB112A]|nr:MAG: hypothetical protein MRERC_13c011 [Mycoplasmataceae bacterium RC_NB112A]KLL01931.1 MAG: hypothetical protein MRERC_6c011 [Mycoplasmataceae bacterium RC_NB112A]
MTDKEKDILCQSEGVVLVQEKDAQVDFTAGEINDLKQKIIFSCMRNENTNFTKINI